MLFNSLTIPVPVVRHCMNAERMQLPSCTPARRIVRSVRLQNPVEQNVTTAANISPCPRPSRTSMSYWQRCVYLSHTYTGCGHAMQYSVTTSTTGYNRTLPRKIHIIARQCKIFIQQHRKANHQYFTICID